MILRVLISTFILMMFSLSCSSSKGIINLCSSHDGRLQGKSRLTGEITDIETGEPLPYVILKLNGIKKTETDLDGNYSFEEIIPGLYAIEVFYLGYESAKIEKIKIDPDRVVILEIGLKAETPIEVY